MRKLLIVAGALAFSFGLFIFWISPESAGPFPSQRRFEVVYTADFERLPKDAQSIRIWIPLASNRDGQTILRREIRAPFGYQVTLDPVYGNEMAYFEIEPALAGLFKVELSYKAEVSRGYFEKAARKKETLGKYLAPSRLMVVNEKVKQRTSEALQGKKTIAQKAKAIYDDVIRRMSYDKTVPGWGRGDTTRACLLGKGNCTDFHSLFISMAHAAEIPARFKIGLTVPEEPEGQIPGYHCWAEFYEETKGWRPLDASEAWKHREKKDAYFGNFDTHKFLISVGRDIDLSPRQSGPPVNIFFYPYVEVDGKEWSGARTSFQFKNLKP